MSTSGYAARVGAAAFLLGASLVAPLAGTTAIASADTPDTAVSGAADTGDSAKPARTGRAPKPTSRAGLDRSVSPRPAAARQTPGRASRTADTVPAPAPAAIEATAAPDIAEKPVAPRTSRPAANPAAAPATTAFTAPTVPAAVAPVAPAPAPTTAPVAAAPALAAPAALATVSAPTGAATSPLAGLFGSFRGWFEGAALLWRRRFFNEAPTVAPVQLTGLTDGLITGTIGAADPEGDVLAYAVTTAPGYGTVTVSQDGNYTYSPGTNFAGIDSFVVAVTDTGKHINLLDLKRPKSTDASVSVAQGAQAPALRFQFIYGSGSQYWSPEARAALESAATKLAGYLVVSSPVTITYAVTGSSSPLSSTLASAGSDFIDPATGFMQTVVQKKIQTGVDGNGAAADGDITWNFGPSWGFGNTVSNTQYDFQSTAMHELLHTLGFLSYADRAGNNTGRTWTIFDSYLVNSNGTAVIGTDYRWNTAYNSNLTGGSGGLFFGGPNAVAAYGGRVPLYTPFPYESGSSLSHLDDDSFAGANEKLMNAVSGQGKGVRVLSPVELGVLADIGYQLAPNTSALMFVGFAFLRRRKVD